MTRRPAEDLFENTRMTFGEHLDELRVTLVRALLGVAVGTLIGFLVADKVVAFLQRPLVRAIKKYNDTYALQEYGEEQGFMPPEMQTRIAEEGVYPERVLVDPGQLVQVIRSINPESLADIDLTPYRIASQSLDNAGAANVASLISGAKSGDESVDARVREISKRLPTETRELLKRISAQPSDALSESERHAVVDALNSVLDDRSLHGEEAFAQVMAPPPTGFMSWFFPAPDNPLQKMKERVDREPENVELSRRLNRMLVTGAFRESIKHPDIDLVPMEIWRKFAEGTQSLGAQEPFMVWMKAALVTGFVISAPWVFYQLWLFVAAGLYPHEQKYVYIYLPLSIGLFLFGVGLAFVAVFDPVLQFLFSFNASMGITPQLRIGEWLTFVLFLPIGFGLAFQLPIVMVFLQRIGIFTGQQYLKQWRIAVMTIAVVSMILTPADPISLFLMGIPLVFLYFFGIALCKWMPRPTSPFGESPG
jgi:sec-independent protein translocase protein TatC